MSDERREYQDAYLNNMEAMFRAMERAEARRAWWKPYRRAAALAVYATGLIVAACFRPAEAPGAGWGVIVGLPTAVIGHSLWFGVVPGWD